MKLTNNALIRKIAQNTRQEESEVKKTLEGMKFVIADSLQEVGSEVRIMNVGAFVLMRYEKTKKRLNGRWIIVPEKTMVKFKPSKKLGNINAIYDEE